MNVQYSTQTVEANRRFEFWKEVVCKHLIPGASWKLEDAPFDGTLDIHEFGSTHVGVLSSPGFHWRRESSHIRVAPDDDIWLGYLIDGTAKVSQGGREASFRSGDMILYDSARPFDFFTAPRKMYALRLRREQLLSRLPRAESMTATVIDSKRPGLMALQSMIVEAATTAFPDAAVADRYLSALLDVVALSMGPQSDQRQAVHERDLFTKVCAYIRERYASAELSLQSLAQAHHVSERTITRAFAMHNQTPMKLVRSVRLQASHRALSGGQARSVTSTAFDCGFTDLSHFSRAFRAEFGCTPHSVLNGLEDQIRPAQTISH
ncbi:helix-turn-helix domain-containing protein [Variovorax sp. efr-133-TYG-130]|uniref:helix-turn-helix domain-containing protein n=1 Tax=Variovorax sp. efr-133-TYG-130 TaxID=3040327 RepID=UPI002553EA41|nr:helix-turn-helix domain-containing protein [Variovorax sp. efr-133-TYG-130]